MWMRMETEFVILPVTKTMTELPTGKPRTGPSARMVQIFKTRMKTMPHPISSKTGSAIERKTPGTDNLRGKIVKISETAYVTKRAQKAEDPRKETVKDREGKGLSPFPSLWGTP